MFGQAQWHVEGATPSHLCFYFCDIKGGENFKRFYVRNRFDRLC